MALGFTWGKTSLSFPFIAYILVSVCTGLYLIKYMYMLNKPISAMIVLILLILVFIFFGKRWFQYGQLKGSAAWVQMDAGTSDQTSTALASQCAGSVSPGTIQTNWPPVVNVCPDFMTLNSSNICVDTNKLYGSGTFTLDTKINPTTQCTSITSNFPKYLRWEGVVQQEGTCQYGNIGKIPYS